MATSAYRRSLPKWQSCDAGELDGLGAELSTLPAGSRTPRIACGLRSRAKVGQDTPHVKDAHKQAGSSPAGRSTRDGRLAPSSLRKPSARMPAAINPTGQAPRGV
jgi:hypothetical protein